MVELSSSAGHLPRLQWKPTKEVLLPSSPAYLGEFLSHIALREIRTQPIHILSLEYQQNQIPTTLSSLFFGTVTSVRLVTEEIPNDLEIIQLCSPAHFWEQSHSLKPSHSDT